jgi:hypothetical protein
MKLSLSNQNSPTKDLEKDYVTFGSRVKHSDEEKHLYDSPQSLAGETMDFTAFKNGTFNLSEVLKEAKN